MSPSYSQEDALSVAKKGEVSLALIINNLIDPRDINYEICKATLISRPKRGFSNTIKFVPPDILKEHPDLAYEAVRQCGLALSFMPDQYKEYAVCLAAVKHNGHALCYVPSDLPDIAKIYEEAVKQNGEAIQHVPEDKRDFDLCLSAAKNTRPKMVEIVLRDYVPDQLRDLVRLELKDPDPDLDKPNGPSKPPSPRSS